MNATEAAKYYCTNKQQEVNKQKKASTDATVKFLYLTSPIIPPSLCPHMNTHRTKFCLWAPVEPPHTLMKQQYEEEHQDDERG
jgi:hypothetical protein